MNSSSTEKLADLISKRLRCLQQLRDLGRKQAEMIAASDMGSLLRVISVKNQLIAALQAIEQQLAPYHNEDPDERVWSSPAARATATAEAETCRQLLDEVMQLERQNEETMIQRRDQLATQLHTAQAANAVRGAYQAQQGAPHRAAHAVPTPHLPSESGLPTAHLDLQSDA